MDTQNISKAIQTFQSGGIVIFPTDTAYGIGCRMDDEKTVERLYEIRKRPKEKAILILVDSVEMAEKYLKKIPEDVLQLMNRYWPGGLTIVLPCKTEHVPSIVRAGGNTLAVRLPAHPQLVEIIRHVGVPIVAPSANFAGEATPVRLEEVSKELQSLVDFVLPGECTLKQSSTLIDCSIQPWRILREGAVNVSI